MVCLLLGNYDMYRYINIINVVYYKHMFNMNLLF